jgi:voltage-gated potassium channel
VVEADATDDEALDAAGCGRAFGLVAALPNDKDNLYLTVAARQHNARVRLVARNAAVRSEDKLRKAGADAAVTTSRIGGLRLASEMIRPTVVSFLDRMLRDKSARRVEEIAVPAGSPYAGRTLAESELRKIGNVLVLAVEKDGDTLYDPLPDTRLEGGMTLVVMGAEEEVWKVRKAAQPA